MIEPAVDGARPLWRRPALVLPVAVLVLALALQGMSVFQETPRPRPAHLDAHVPTTLAGWRVRDVPLGPNEFLQGQVERILNFDEVVFREYQRPGMSLGVYVAYWGPGKMPARLVASHTPDRCWTENGWTCLEMRFKEAHAVDGRSLQPAEWRLFRSPSGDRTHVLYWHLVEGRIYDYGERFNAVPHPLKWWRDALQQALFGSREQYFVRLTSDVPFDRIWDDPGFQEVLRGLAALGVAAPAVAPGGG